MYSSRLSGHAQFKEFALLPKSSYLQASSSSIRQEDAAQFQKDEVADAIYIGEHSPAATYYGSSTVPEPLHKPAATPSTIISAKELMHLFPCKNSSVDLRLKKEVDGTVSLHSLTHKPLGRVIDEHVDSKLHKLLSYANASEKRRHYVGELESDKRPRIHRAVSCRSSRGESGAITREFADRFS
jgi:hypothetical protein